VLYLIFHIYACFCEWSIVHLRKMHLQMRRNTLLGIFITIQSLKFFGDKTWRLTVNWTGSYFPYLTTYSTWFILGKWGESFVYKFSERKILLISTLSCGLNSILKYIKYIYMYPFPHPQSLRNVEYGMCENTK
jgi:hypothetical protein